MEEKKDKQCKWCKKDIHIEASVCHHCSRHQSSFMRNLENYNIPVGIFISIIMVVLSIYSALEARKEQIIASNAKAEVEKVANIMVKISHIIADGSSNWDGMPKAHLNKIKEYENEIKDILDSNLNQQIEKDLKEINSKKKNQK